MSCLIPVEYTQVLRTHEPLRVIRRGLPLEFSQKLQAAAQVGTVKVDV